MLGLNVQPNTLVHHAMVAPGSVLARSVCVMCPWRPRVGTCRAGGDFDGFFGAFLTGLCLVRCGFFFMAVGDGDGGNLAAIDTVRNEALGHRGGCAVSKRYFARSYNTFMPARRMLRNEGFGRSAVSG